MKNKSILGSLLLIILLASAVISIWFPKLLGLQVLNPHTTIYASFTNVANLPTYAKVTTAGVQIGYVADIVLDYDNQQAKVVLAIEDDQIQIQQDSIAAIVTTSLFG